MSVTPFVVKSKQIECWISLFHEGLFWTQKLTPRPTSFVCTVLPGIIPADLCESWKRLEVGGKRPLPVTRNSGKSLICQGARNPRKAVSGELGVGKIVTKKGKNINRKEESMKKRMVFFILPILFLCFGMAFGAARDKDTLVIARRWMRPLLTR